LDLAELAVDTLVEVVDTLAVRIRVVGSLVVGILEHRTFKVINYYKCLWVSLLEIPT
jgi:hypothetical protein